MSVFTVPPLDETPWPSLYWQLVPWMEKNLVFGPGDKRGEKLVLDDERKALLYRMYEVYPREHPRAGRRRFRRAAISVRKGVGKTELLALVAAAELHPRAPVRCVGWQHVKTAGGMMWMPVGGPVKDAYIPLVAYSEEQSEDLAYGALRVILGLSPVAKDFDIGLERIMRADGSGKAVALASSPDARDGARTTFAGLDETHRWVLPRLKRAHRTMLANLPKRKVADAWSLETTTAPEPGQNSVAEETMAYAEAVRDGKTEDSQLYFFHRQASETHDLATAEGRRAAVLEASGPTAGWSDVDGIVEQFNDPTADVAYLRRVWLNQLVRSSDRAFDVLRWRELSRPNYVIPKGAKVAVGFDGSRRQDSTALVVTEIASGFQMLLGIWEKPLGPAGEQWSVPTADVNERVAYAFEEWDVCRMHADPPYWDAEVSTWEGLYGDDRVVRWHTGVNHRKMAYSVRSYVNAIIDGSLTHDGSRDFERHIANAFKRPIPQRDEQGQPLFEIQKERHDSPNKMDAAMAGCLSWEARNDAISEGANLSTEPSVYESRGVLVL